VAAPPVGEAPEDEGSGSRGAQRGRRISPRA
jgi:hypothetical protein